MANMRYGCPYMGSKNSIARPIVDFLPRRKNFIDLFAGGCAITHAALLNVKKDGSVKQEGLFIPKDKLGWWKKNTITEGECLIYEQTTLF